MRESVEKSPIRHSLRTFLLIASIVIIRQGFVGDPNWYWALLLTIPAYMAFSLSGSRFFGRGSKQDHSGAIRFHTEETAQKQHHTGASSPAAAARAR